MAFRILSSPLVRIWNERGEHADPGKHPEYYETPFVGIWNEQRLGGDIGSEGLGMYVLAIKRKLESEGEEEVEQLHALKLLLVVGGWGLGRIERRRMVMKTQIRVVLMRRTRMSEGEH